MNYYSSRSFVGAMHPVLFFLIVCGITLLLACFIGNALYAHLNPHTGLLVVNGSAAGADLAQATLPATGH